MNPSLQNLNTTENTSTNVVYIMLVANYNLSAIKKGLAISTLIREFSKQHDPIMRALKRLSYFSNINKTDWKSYFD